ncbi:hypothetical protein HPB52_001824 [Rhipicephalus sanguineus]|uniref:E3 ubiquitin-protein ligase n=1 Tax=Rhipicephalus sanguineus TaxID=34632 RepID=A0A9D4PFS7_RHISA|nr:hypothetical protein HPB52_001824 [Rhipicephalus sanguineus]
MYPDFRLSEAFLPVQQGGERMDPVTSALSATYAQTSATSISELAVLFECPVCRDYALPPILQCENGHHLCATCRQSVTRCPVCRARKGENILITATRFDRAEAFCWFALQTCLGRDFVVMLKKRSNNSCCKHFIGLVALVGSSLEAQNFVYRLQFCGAKHRITWEARMQGIHSLAESVESGEGLLFDSSTARRLCNGTDLIMDVAISVAALCGDKAP